MSLLFNTLSLSWLSCQEANNFMAVVIIHSDCRAQEEEICTTSPYSPFDVCHEVMGPDAMILALSLSSFTLI